MGASSGRAQVPKDRRDLSTFCTQAQDCDGETRSSDRRRNTDLTKVDLLPELDIHEWSLPVTLITLLHYAARKSYSVHLP